MKKHCLAIVPVLAVVCLLSNVCAWGDVLITKSGSKWVGTVTREGDNYHIRLASGGSMVLPARSVREVITPVKKKAEFAKMTAAANLHSDAKVSELIAFADKWALVEEKEALLRKAYKLRLAKANRKDPIALAKLAVWCERNGLATQAAECEEQAVKLAPDDEDVQEILNQVFGWKAAVLCARNHQTFRHTLLVFTNYVSTKNRKEKKQTRSLAIIRLRLRSPALKAAKPGQWLNRKPDTLSKEHLANLLRYPKAKKTRLALLDGSEFKLTLPDGQSVKPIFLFVRSSQERWSWGTDNVKGQKRILSIPDGKQPDNLVSWTRSRGVYFALVRPKTQLEVTVLFEVSPDVSRGKLSLSGNHVSDVTLPKGQMPKYRQ